MQLSVLMKSMKLVKHRVSYLNIGMKMIYEYVLYISNTEYPYGYT